MVEHPGAKPNALRGLSVKTGETEMLVLGAGFGELSSLGP